MLSVPIHVRLLGVALVSTTLVTTPASPAGAEPVSNSDSRTPRVAAASGWKAETVDLVQASPKSQRASLSVAAGASICTGGIDYPHISGNSPAPYTINTHLDQVCRVVPSQSSIEGSLYRSRWFGWEHLVSGQATKIATAKWSLFLNKGCTPGDWYRYRAAGRFYALAGTTRWSVSFYNENPSEIKCVSRPGASD